MGLIEKEMKRWVFIIQALDNSAKLKTGCGIFKDLKKWCNDSDTGIIPKYFEINSKRDLEGCINEIISLVQEEDSLILHIESHGNYDGIWLVNEGIGWNDFWKEINSISEKVNNKIVYILSMCRSKYSSLVFPVNCHAMPFQHLIVSNDEVNSGLACLALKKFYNEYISSKNINKSFEMLQFDYISHGNNCPFLLLLPQDIIQMRESIKHDYEIVRKEKIT